MPKFLALMSSALAGMPAMFRLNFPNELKFALLEQSAELDRLRAEVIDLRSKIETKE